MLAPSRWCSGRSIVTQARTPHSSRDGSGPQRFRRLLARLVFFAGLAALAHGTWIPAKARLAQVLLHRAWEQTLAGAVGAKPWPWADTWPTGRLRHRDVDLIVLAGASGATMAFGPGHISGTAVPGIAGNVALAGHRDTHFTFLEDLEVSDRLLLQAPDGRSRSYRVSTIEVVDRHRVDVLKPGPDRLTLVTCYPFDAVVAGGPLRYVVVAVPEA